MSNEPDTSPAPEAASNRLEQVNRLYKLARLLRLLKVDLTADHVRTLLNFMGVDDPEGVLHDAIEYANRQANAAHGQISRDFDTVDDGAWIYLESYAQEAATAFADACSAIQSEEDQYTEGETINPLEWLFVKMAELDRMVPVS